MSKKAPQIDTLASDPLDIDIPDAPETHTLNAEEKGEGEQDQNNKHTSNTEKSFHNHALIFVLSGIHKGANCVIEEETSIGSDIDNDLIITDDYIDKRHVILRPIQKGLDYAIEVICKGKNIIINGEVLLEIEQNIIMQNTFTVTLGTITINVTLHKDAKSSIIYKKYLRPKLNALDEIKGTTKEILSPQNIVSDIRNIALFLIAILAIVSILIYLAMRPPEKKILKKTYADYKHIKSIPFKEKNMSLVLHEQAKSDLIDILKKYKLDLRTEITSKNGVLFVKGRLNQYEMKQWRKVRNWFDTIYGTRQNLIELIDINNGQRRTISFKAVVADGDIPYVVSWTGDRFRPGATLPGGWIILKISEDGVVVKDGVDNRIFLVKHIRASHGLRMPNFRQ